MCFIFSPTGAILDQLRHNTDRYFRRCFGVDGKAYWTKYHFKGALMNTLINQFFVDRVSLSATADHADVARLGFQGLGQNLLIETVSPGHDDD